MLDTIKELQRLAQSQPWLIEEFVCVANDTLRNFLPETKGNEKIKDEVNARLIRHYTTEGLLAPPQREGRNAVYNYKHLLQLLVVRRLLAQGIVASAIDKVSIQKSDTELEKFLIGSAELQVMSINSELAYKNWTHIPITEGLELNLRSDLDIESEEKLLKEIAQKLKQHKLYSSSNQINKTGDNSHMKLQDKAMTRTVKKLFDDFNDIYGHTVNQTKQNKWQESPEGWDYHALIHMNHWILHDTRNLNHDEAWQEVKNKNIAELTVNLFEIAPELKQTVSELFEQFTKYRPVVIPKFKKPNHEKWERSSEGWEYHALQYMVYWTVVENYELTHQEACQLIEGKTKPQLRKRLFKFAPELYR